MVSGAGVVLKIRKEWKPSHSYHKKKEVCYALTMLMSSPPYSKSHTDVGGSFYVLLSLVN